MIKTLIAAFKIFLLSALIIWLINLPGYINVQIGSYTIKTQLGFICLCVLVVLIIILTIHRIYLYILSMPERRKHKRTRHMMQDGTSLVIGGLSALTAGDTKAALHYTKQLDRHYPDAKPLVKLLQAHTAHTNKDYAIADTLYHELIEDQDTVFLGLHGLTSMASEQNRIQDALYYAQHAAQLHPKQARVLRQLYILQVQSRQWTDALKTLRKIEKLGGLTQDAILSDRVALFVAQSETLYTEGQVQSAITTLKKALKIDPAFVPAIERLVTYYIDNGQHRKARALLKQSWKIAPHPSLAQKWVMIAPAKTADNIVKMMKHTKSLIEWQPNEPSGYDVSAKLATNHSLWGEARSILEQGIQNAPVTHLYHTLADLEERQEDFEAAQTYRETAKTVQSQKMWFCQKTGRIYDAWSPIAKPHGSFNTIRWGWPDIRTPHHAANDISHNSNPNILSGYAPLLS